MHGGQFMVPIVILFGHTSADASRPSPYIRTEDPLYSGRLGCARFRTGVRLLHIRRPSGTRSHWLARATRGDTNLARSGGARRLRRAHCAAPAASDASLLTVCFPL